jgi:filamentous hemagglutinin family protein
MENYRRDLMCGAAISALLIASPMAPARANPQNGVVVGGAATVTSAGNTVRIDQSTRIVVIDWNSFNIAQGETTTFHQPGSSATAVNRVGGQDPSKILGNLNANGRVIIINGNGILFGPKARVNVGSLIATTQDASNSDLMSGKATFSGNSAATVENQGTITAATGGVIGLIAGAVSNSGYIGAKLGSVTLGASTQFTLDFTGDRLISFPVDARVLANAIGADGKPVQALIVNKGRVEGATVLLSAHAAQNLVQNVIDMSGIVTATAAHNSGGDIVLDGGGGAVAVSGMLAASGSQGTGGAINVNGGSVSLAGAAVNATGATGGGNVALGGWSAAALTADSATSIDASATGNGDGGHVSVIAQKTQFAGKIAARGGAKSGDGGNVETSGYFLNIDGAFVDTLAPHGKTGNWLLDPYTVEICGDSTPGGCTTSGYSFPDTTADGSTSTINVDDLVRDLATTNVTIAAHGPDTSTDTTGTGTPAGSSPTTGGDPNTSGGGTTIVPPTSGSETGTNPTTGGDPGTPDGGTTGSNPTGGSTAGGDTGGPSGGGPSTGITGASDITVLVPISWSAPTVLELGAYGTIDIEAPITVGGGGGLVLGDASDSTLQPGKIKIAANIDFTGTSAGASSVFTMNPDVGGSWALYNHAIVSFADTNYAFSFGTASYTLIGDAATLASDLSAAPGGTYALAKDIDISGTTYTAPLAATFTGLFEGLNHTIDGLTINDATDANVGMFGEIASYSTVQDLVLTNLSVTGTASSANVGGLAGYNNGFVNNVSVAGAVTGGASANVGGLIGFNERAVQYAMVNTIVTGGDSSVVGGFTGFDDGGIGYSSAAGTAIGGNSATVGGFSGSENGQVVEGLSTTFVAGGSDAIVGGFVGYTVNGQLIVDSYFDTDTSGTTLANGSAPDRRSPIGALGGSTVGLQSALPNGFDSTRWAIDPGKSYPYPINAYSAAPQVISGTVHNGATALGSSGSGLVNVGVLIDGTKTGDAVAGANGYYYMAVQPGTLSGTQQLLTYLDGNTVKANTYVQNPSADVGADLYGGSFRVQSGAATLSSVLSGISTAIGANSGSDFLYDGSSFSAGTVDLDLSDTSGFAIDSALNAGFGMLIINASGPVTQSAAITAANLELLGSGVSYTLTNTGNSIGTVAGTVGAISLTDSGVLLIGTVNGISGLASSGAVTLAATDITIDSGAQIAAGSGDDIALEASGNFINGEGSDALAVSGGGRWLIYSGAPETDTFNDLDSANTAIWNATAATLAPGAVGASGNRYIFAYQPTVTFTSTDAAKTYGDTISLVSDYSVSGIEAGISGAFLGDNANSVFSGAPVLSSAGAATTASVNGGPYGITIAAGTLSALNGYALDLSSGGHLTVAARPITVTADSLSREYGNANPAFTYAVGGDGLVNGDTLDGSLATSATAASNVGGYGITQGTLASSNYDITNFTDGTLTVTARPITVMADNLSREYGNANPTFTYTIGGDGLVNGDSLSGALATSATTASDVGSYDITQGTLAAPGNYDITAFTDGTLSVTARPITVTADDLSRIYGNANPALTYTVGGEGLVNGGALSGALTTSATTASNAGNYDIARGSLSASSNYALTFADGTLAITARPITVTADNLSRVYGNANPVLTYTVGGNGLVNGDSLTGALITSATTASNVGSYAIGEGTLAASANYRLTFDAGALSITARPISITANSLSRVYGDANPVLTYTVGGDGLVNGDSLTGALATSATTASNVGNYAITEGTLAESGNYEITNFTGGALTVTTRPITVMSNDLSRIYGNANPVLTYTVGGDGLVNGDTLTGALATSAASGSSVGSYDIAQGTLATSDNYEVASFSSGTLTIVARPITVTADDLSRTYGDANPPLTYTIGGDGLVNGDTLTGGLATSATTSSGTGSYEIAQGTLEASSNYNMAFIAGTLTIAPAITNSTPGIAGQENMLGTSNQSGVQNSQQTSSGFANIAPGSGPGVQSLNCVVNNSSSPCTGATD